MSDSRFRFRAWLWLDEAKTEGEWVDPENFLIDGNGNALLVSAGSHLDTIEAVYTGGFEIVQFTGLHDSKGKEIYEGDLIRYKNGLTLEIVFEDGAYWTKLATPSLRLSLHLEKGFEVIGNVYETPELLEGGE